MVQTAFWRFEIVGSSNPMSVLLTDLAVSLEWITVTLNVDTVQTHGTKCVLEVSGSGEFESHVHFVDRFGC